MAASGIVQLPDDTSFLTALSTADAANKLVVLYFTADW